MIHISLPFPPALNNLFATFNNRRIPSRRYKAWLAEAQTSLRAQRPGALTGAFEASLILSPPDRRKRDLDGLAKAILDLLTKEAVIEDDSLARKLTLAWAEGAPARPGYALVEIEACDPPVWAVAARRPVNLGLAA
jgi:crossover junction endodeoxyribonuclease RusA